jgi:hypothetical protein
MGLTPISAVLSNNEDGAMDEVQQLANMLQNYAAGEELKKQQFEAQCQAWGQGISDLYRDIEGWLAPLSGAGLLEITREPYIAVDSAFPLPVSPFVSEKLAVTLALRSVELIPQVMAAKGQIVISVVGLTSDRYGSISLVRPATGEAWQWRKDRGIKEPEVHELTADYLAVQLQGLIPRARD